MERLEGPVKVIIEIPVGSTASISVSNVQSTEVPSRRVPKAPAIDVKRKYPREASIDPDIIGEYIQTRNDLGTDHTETEAAWSNLTSGIQAAHQRGFDFEEVDRDFEDTVFETRRNYDGRTMGSESMRIKPIRDEFEIEKLKEWYPDEPYQEETFSNTQFPDDPA